MEPSSAHPTGDLSDIRFAVVDVETSGLRASRHRVLQVAVVVTTADGTVVDRFDSLIRPRFGRWSRIGPRHIHGLTRRALAAAPPPREVVAEVARRLHGAVFTAHNAAFDRAFLARCSRIAGVPLPDEPQLCTLTLSRALDPARERSHRLGDLCQRYGVVLERAHDAAADAEATAALLPHLLREAGISTVGQLEVVLVR